MWLALVEQCEMGAALLRAGAQWDSKKVGELLSRSHARLKELLLGEDPEPDWEPPSLERVKRNMANASKN